MVSQSKKPRVVVSPSFHTVDLDGLEHGLGAGDYGLWKLPGDHAFQGLQAQQVEVHMDLIGMKRTEPGPYQDTACKVPILEVFYPSAPVG